MYPGLYLHIPFCQKQCIYCDFYVLTQKTGREHFHQLLGHELQLVDRNQVFPFEKIDSIYFGGGTPSLLSLSQVEYLLLEAQQYYRLDKESEITFEVTPGTVDFDYLKGLKELGINRVSLGVESFQDETLKWMNRDHDLQKTEESMDAIKRIGFDKWSLDLIHSIPTESEKKCLENVQKAISYKPDHLSIYSLTVEAGTVLDSWVESQMIEEYPAEKSGDLMEKIQKLTTESGYPQYELSNYALKENQAYHNQKYWAFIPYLGIGPSAHSYDGKKRWQNRSDFSYYQSQLKQDELPMDDAETLTKEQRWMESIFLGLRSEQGIVFERLEKEFSEEQVEELKQKALALVVDGFAYLHTNKINLTPKGYRLYNQVIRYFVGS